MCFGEPCAGAVPSVFTFHDPHKRRQDLGRSGSITLFSDFCYLDDKLLALAVTSGKNVNDELNLAVPDI